MGHQRRKGNSFCCEIIKNSSKLNNKNPIVFGDRIFCVVFNWTIPQSAYADSPLPRKGPFCINIIISVLFVYLILFQTGTSFGCLCGFESVEIKKIGAKNTVAKNLAVLDKNSKNVFIVIPLFVWLSRPYD